MQDCAECSGRGYILGSHGEVVDCEFCNGTGSIPDEMFEKPQYFTITAFPSNRKRDRVELPRIISFEPGDGVYLAIGETGKRYAFPYEHWELITIDPERREGDAPLRRVQ